MEWYEISILLILSHFVCDYVLQTDSIAKGKNHMLNTPLYGVSFVYWLTAHASTHAIAVYIVTQSIWLCLIELISHWIVDYMKCNGNISLHEDQTMHIIIKVLIVILFMLGV